MDVRSVRPRESPEAAGSARSAPRVVVGVDGSDASRAALRYAFAAAARRGASLDVVAAYPVGLPWRWDPAIDGPDVEAVRADMEAQARSFGNEVRTGAPGVEDVPVQVVTAPGHAARILVDRAEGADLLVVGSRGRGAVGSAVLGSVALHCVTEASSPVVVVHAGYSEAGAARPVVVGLDDCPEATAVLLAGLDEAARLGADLEVVAAYQGSHHWTGAGAGAHPEELQSRVQQRVEAVVAEVKDRAGARLGDRLPAVRTSVVPGSAYEVLTDRARDAQLLVVGSRGHGAVRGLLLGSVALHVVVSARVPVMVVHPAAVPASADAGARETVPG
jgi:nucleotide-binding universal stress UspA family protein